MVGSPISATATTSAISNSSLNNHLMSSYGSFDSIGEVMQHNGTSYHQLQNDPAHYSTDSTAIQLVDYTLNKSDDQKSSMVVSGTNAAVSLASSIRVSNTPSPHYVNIEFPVRTTTDNFNNFQTSKLNPNIVYRDVNIQPNTGYNINTTKNVPKSQPNQGATGAMNTESTTKPVLNVSSRTSKKFDDHSYVNIDYSKPFTLQ